MYLSREHRRLPLTIGIAVTTLPALSIAGPAAAASTQSEELDLLYDEASECDDSNVVVYGPGAPTWQPLVDVFNDRYPDVIVDLVNLVGPEQITRLQAEFDSGNVVADLAFATQASAALMPQYSDWFEPWVPTTASELAEGLVGPEAEPYWFAPYGGVFGWAYNTNEVDAENAPSWGDVIDEAYEGEVAVVNPAAPNASTAGMWLAYDLGLTDDGWFTALADNGTQVYGDSARVGQALVTGEASVAAYSFNLAVSLAQSGAPVAFNPLDAIALPSTVGVVKESQCLPAAKLLAAFMLSTDAQAVIATQGQFPFMPSAPIPDELNEISPEVYIVEDPDGYIELNNKVLDLGAQAFGIE